MQMLLAGLLDVRRQRSAASNTAAPLTLPRSLRRAASRGPVRSATLRVRDAGTQTCVSESVSSAAEKRARTRLAC